MLQKRQRQLFHRSLRSGEKRKIYSIAYSHRTQGKGVERVHIDGMIHGFEKYGHIVKRISPFKNDSVNRNRAGIRSRFISLLCKYLPEVIFELLEILFNFILSVKLFRICKRDRVNFIYERYAFFNFSGYLVSKLLRIPFYLELNFLTITQLSRERTRLLLSLARYIERLLLRQATGIAVITEYLHNRCQELGVPRTKLIFTANGIDTQSVHVTIDKHSLIEKYNLTGKVVVGFIGGFYFWQRLNLLVEFLEKNIEENPDIHFLLVGDGPEREPLVKLIAEKNFNDHFTFTGYIEHEHVWSYINLFDIALIPGSNDYGSPVKLFEYMAMGKAVLGPSLAPVTAVITHDNNGYVFENNNLEDFGKKLNELVRDEEKRKLIGSNAKKEVYEKYTYQNNADRILNHYVNTAQLHVGIKYPN